MKALFTIKFKANKKLKQITERLFFLETFADGEINGMVVFARIAVIDAQIQVFSL